MVPKAVPVANALYGSAVKKPLAVPDDEIPGGEDELELLDMVDAGVMSVRSFDPLPPSGDGPSCDV
jgi:hypothetical protein